MVVVISCIFKTLEAMLKEICAALLSADVNVMLVSKLRNNIRQKVNLENQGAAINVKKVIQKVDFSFFSVFFFFSFFFSSSFPLFLSFPLFSSLFLSFPLFSSFLFRFLISPAKRPCLKNFVLFWTLECQHTNQQKGGKML